MGAMFGESLVGKTINENYKIVEEIARGGMAMVYRAHQISMDRFVAIKILPQEFLHEASFLERFKREAAIVARLEHRAIVPVYDFGEWNGMPYIVMRYLDGGSVDRLIDRGPIDLTRVQTIIRQVASALDYAHANGVLHRDLKPNNILLDRNEDAYITDFGIARLASSNEQLTSTGVVGTPAYMSPEQAQGHDLDSRSDLYSLGIVLFEMLTGRRPFDGETPYSIAVMQVTTEPPSPRDFNPTIPPGVERVVMKSIEKDRTRRFQSASEMAGTLDDADLMPLADTLLHTPPPDYPSSHDEPTPSRPSLRVDAQAWSPPPQRRVRGRPAAAVYLGVALFIGLIMGIGVLAAYLILSRDVEADAPDFAATGVFRLTATASGGIGAPSRVEGQLLYVSDRDGQPDLYLLDLATGNENRLTNTAGAEGTPVISPDGAWMAYVFDPDSSFADGGTQAEIFISRMDGGDLRQVTSNLLEENSPTWTPDGEALIFVRLIEDGTAYRIVRYNIASERETTLYEGQGRAQYPSVSADGASILFGAGEVSDFDTWEIYLMNVASRETVQLTDNDEADWSPRWHPDGSKILFLRSGLGGASMMEMRADGSGQVQIFDGPGGESGPIYTPDGERILFSSEFDSAIANLFLLSAETQHIEQLTFNGGYDSVWLP